MKTPLFLLLVFSFAATASASSRFAGTYYAVTYSNGVIVAAVNFKIKANGKFKGMGESSKFSEIDLSGRTDEDGNFTVTEAGLGAGPSYSGVLSGNGNYTVHLANGNVVKCKRAVGSPEAGAYKLTGTFSPDVLFIIDKQHQISGGICSFQSGITDLITGLATSENVSMSTDDGSYTFEADFSGGTSLGGSATHNGDQEDVEGSRL